jgi:prophage maintenance system killer protein
MSLPPKQLAIFQAPNGAIELRADSKAETIRANRMQMAEIFEVNPQAISKHIQNIYKEWELIKLSTSSKMELIQNESGRTVRRKVDYYNLDVLISVWYRISSVTWTKFRQRATKTLKQHITKWFTINKKQLVKNYEVFLQAVESVKTLAHNKSIWSDEILELIKTFSQTWFSLSAFDTWHFDLKQQTQKSIKLHAHELFEDILILKHQLIERGEASDLFAQQKQLGTLEGIFWNIFQSAFGKDVYPSIASKAAHLLYFVIKNHPFTDGNKRSGAFAFIWLLQKAGVGFHKNITPSALTALTLLIATSDPQDKARMTDLIILLLSQT